MSTGYPLVYAWRLNSQGGGRTMSWSEIMVSPARTLSPCWLHLNRNSEAAVQWLMHRSGMDEFVQEALLTLETRPRCIRHEDGIILYLRGVNLNENADPHDMLTIRVWVDQHNILSLRRRRMFSPEDINTLLEKGEGPFTPGDLMVLLIERITQRMEPVLATLRDKLDEVEQVVLSAENHHHLHMREHQHMRAQLGQLRISAVSMRRYLGPQRDALVRLASEHPPWMSAEHRANIRELANDTTRYLEDLDEIRDTAGILQDQIAGTQSEMLNKLLYQLTLVTVFFMPLSFLVGFFGSNTGGMFWGGDPSDPGQWGAVYELALLVAVSVAELALFRVLKWV